MVADGDFSFERAELLAGVGLRGLEAKDEAARRTLTWL